MRVYIKTMLFSFAVIFFLELSFAVIKRSSPCEKAQQEADDQQAKGQSPNFLFKKMSDPLTLYVRFVELVYGA
jgi:hypothetical protein